MSPRPIQSRLRYAKKRVVRKFIAVNGNYVFSTAQLDVDLDLIEEVETLVRVVGNICVRRYAASQPGTGFHMVIALARGGQTSVTIPSPGAAGSIDGRQAKDVLWTGSGNWGLVDTHQNYPVDVKGMRKLAETDKLQLSTRAEEATAFKAAWMLTMFYKKA